MARADSVDEACGSVFISDGRAIPSLDAPEASSPDDAAVESESEAESSNVLQSRAEKRRARTCLFNSWIFRAAEKNLSAQIRRDEKTAADEELSIRALLAQNESTPVITDPREYQIELFERAKKQNTIAVLDTGSGKTLIAVLLLRHVIDQELEDRHQGKPPRISFFLVRRMCDESRSTNPTHSPCARSLRSRLSFNNSPYLRSISSTVWIVSVEP